MQRCGPPWTARAQASVFAGAGDKHKPRDVARVAAQNTRRDARTISYDGDIYNILAVQEIVRRASCAKCRTRGIWVMADKVKTVPTLPRQAREHTRPVTGLRCIEKARRLATWLRKTSVRWWTLTARRWGLQQQPACQHQRLRPRH